MEVGLKVYSKDVRPSDRVNSRENQKHIGKSAQQAKQMVGPIHFAANEFEPFQAHRLGLGRHLDRKP